MNTPRRFTLAIFPVVILGAGSALWAKSRAYKMTRTTHATATQPTAHESPGTQGF